MPERAATGLRQSVATDAHGKTIDPHTSRTGAQLPMPAVDAAETRTASRPIRVRTSELTTETSSRREAPHTQPASTQDPYDDVETLSRGSLQLQAISWSQVSSARITVIDGRILREGQSIEGYTVTQIRPEDIIVSKAGKLWRLAYNNQ